MREDNELKLDIFDLNIQKKVSEFFQKIEYWISSPVVESDTLMGNSPLKDSCLRYTEDSQEQNFVGKGHNKKQGGGEPMKAHWLHQ